MFRIGCIDCPRVLFRIIPTWSLKNTEVLRIGLDFIVSVLLSASVEIVGVSRMWDFYVVFHCVVIWLSNIILFSIFSMFTLSFWIYIHLSFLKDLHLFFIFHLKDCFGHLVSHLGSEHESSGWVYWHPLSLY